MKTSARFQIILAVYTAALCIATDSLAILTVASLLWLLLYLAALWEER